MIVLLILAGSLVNVYTDYLWFGEVGYRKVFSAILRTRIVLFVVFGLAMALIIGGNVLLAYRLRPPFRPMSQEQQNLERYRIALEPRKLLALIVLSVIAFLAAGSSAQGNWKAWILYFNGGSFGIKDPQFHRDVSFFAWDYPIYRLLLGFFFTGIIFSILLSAAVYYLYGALRLQTPGPKITLSARRHLTMLVFFFIVFKAFAYWLDRYGLVFSSRGKVNGASYTDVNASLPSKTILFWIAVIIAVGVLASIWMSSPTIPAISFGVLLVLSIVISGIYPALVQQFSVKPNASTKEAPYIERNITATRQAYGIVTSTDGGSVTYDNYAATDTAPASALTGTTSTYASTIGNIRLLDPNVVSPTFTQLQQLRNIYGFADKLDIDRYTENNKTTDYVVGVRELKAANLSSTGGNNQTNWINKHTVYTHGYGFVAADAGKALSSQDQFSEGDIPPTGFVKIAQPEVYYGELGVDYSIVGATGTPREFNGSDQTKSTYTGTGGVKLSNVFTRLAFAVKYGEINFLLNDAAKAKGAKIIFDRNPRQRVLKVAPYLKVDGDPYPAVIGGRIVWMLDGYTTMSNYPYSEKEQLGDVTADSLTSQNRTAKQPDASFNYIRNSVKATVDAYDGTVKLYAWDDTDPVLKAWMKAFPGTILPKSAMPADVMAHVRYPQDLFEVQRALLAQYHVSDPVQFYNASDQWSVPTDPYVPGENQPPYYQLAAAPNTTTGTEFQLTSPMKVLSRDNLAAYISVDADPGPNYGKFTVLRLPSGSAVLGPTQVANQFKSQTRVSQEVTLFDQGGSKVVYANLLTLPVGGGFLYVQPLYVQGSGTAIPILRRVIVYYGDKIGYDDTLAGALLNLSQPVVGQGIDDAVTATGGPTTSATPTVTPSTGTTLPANPTINQILTQINDASQRLQDGYRTGNFTEVGQAQADLARLSAQYLQVEASASGSSTPTVKPS